jgi:hypothetical protein
MNLAPKKLSLAHRLLVDMLAAGAQPVASCLDRAAEVGISQRTLHEARRRLPIECMVALALVLAGGGWQTLQATRHQNGNIANCDIVSAAGS